MFDNFLVPLPYGGVALASLGPALTGGAFLC